MHAQRILAATITTLLLTGIAHAEPVTCQKQAVKNLLKFKKSYVKALTKCVEAENLGKIAGPCPDATAQDKIAILKLKVRTKLGVVCPPPDLSTLGFPSTCAYESESSGIEGACAALPVTSPEEFADCLMCWKGAELSEFVATLYASHASELCGGAFDETSPSCSTMDCATPLPVQHDLGDSGENDCQRAIGKAGVKHLLTVEKILEKCGLAGNDRTTCLADDVNEEKLAKSEAKLDKLIRDKCGNRDPVPDPPFCCRTGMGNACTAVTTRADCELIDGQVQENKTCGLGGNCDPVGGGGQTITWWSTCPRSDTCTGALTTLDDLITCVDDTVDEITHELLCIQFATGWGPCPADASPSGAFLD